MSEIVVCFPHPLSQSEAMLRMKALVSKAHEKVLLEEHWEQNVLFVSAKEISGRFSFQNEKIDIFIQVPRTFRFWSRKIETELRKQLQMQFS